MSHAWTIIGRARATTEYSTVLEVTVFDGVNRINIENI